MTERSLTHVDHLGRARMVDVTGKDVTQRHATARCVVRASTAAVKSLCEDADAIAFSRAAGSLGAVRAPELVPLCHPLPLDDVIIEVEVQEAEAGAEAPEVSIDIVAETSVVARTGVEIEALTACGLTALGLLRALLPLDPTARIDTLALWEKSGGRSGTWQRAASSEIDVKRSE